MTEFDTTLPPPLAALMALETAERAARDDRDPDDDDDDIDFEPYDSFSSAGENLSWIRAWTGNKTLTGEQLRFFGQDGTGGLAGVFVADPGRDLLDNPIVFFGSEGEIAVVAADFSDYLWLRAGGFGPCEATFSPAQERRPNPRFVAFAGDHANSPRRSPHEILKRAREAYPELEADFRALCR